MKILITKDGERVTTVGGVQKAADYLGWTAEQVKELIASGETRDGIAVDYEIAERTGSAVCAYTPTSVHRYESYAQCARAYGISRGRLNRLIESGCTWDDGITTFDIPLD